MKSKKKLQSIQAESEGRFDLIASYPTLDASGHVFNALSVWSKKLRDGCGPSEIEAATQAAEKALIELNVAMRKDLALSFDADSRFPSAEVFRGKRGMARKRQNREIVDE